MNVLTSGLTRPMVELLRWYQHAPGERKRRWKQRPHPNRAQNLALLHRGLVDGNVLELDDSVVITRITKEGRQLLKLIDKDPRAWMPKE